MNDLRYKARDRAAFAHAFAALRASGLLGPERVPLAMLPLAETDAEGEPIAFGAPGRAAISGNDPLVGPFEAPAAGDPEYWYVAIRTERTAEEIEAAGITAEALAALGLEVASPEESAAVLGVWAGD